MECYLAYLRTQSKPSIESLKILKRCIDKHSGEWVFASFEQNGIPVTWDTFIEHCSSVNPNVRIEYNWHYEYDIDNYRFISESTTK